MGSKIIEIFNKIAYNVLSALYQPFWAAVLLAFLTMFLYLYGKEHGWKKNSFIRNMLERGGEHLKVLQIFAGHSY